MSANLESRLVNSLSARLKLSLLIFLTAKNDIKTIFEPFEDVEIPEELRDVQRNLLSLHHQLTTIVDSEDSASALLTMEADLEKLISVSQTHLLLRYVVRNADDACGLTDARNLVLGQKEPISLDIHQILDSCENMLNQLEGNDLDAANRQLIAAMPVKMTKGRLGDYIAEGLRSISYSPIFELVFGQMIKQNVLPEVSPAYGKHFAPQCEEAKTLYLKALASPDAEALIALQDELKLFSEEFVEPVTVMLNQLVESVSMALIFLPFCEMLATLLQNDLPLKDLYYLYTQPEIDEALGETAQERAEERIEALIDIVRREDQAVRKEMKKAPENDPYLETLLDELAAWQRLSRLYYNDSTSILQERLEQHMSDRLMEQDSADWVNAEWLNETVSDILAAQSTYPPQERRVWRQVAMRYFICPYPKDQLLQYLHDTLHESSPEEQMIAALLIGQILYETGYMDEPLDEQEVPEDYQGHGHTHNYGHDYHGPAHIHGEHCACGHDHDDHPHGH